MEPVLGGYTSSLRDYCPSQYLGGYGSRRLDRLNMVPGLVVDFTGERHDGRVWDFNDPDMAEEAEKMVMDKRAMVIIVNPVCVVEGLASKLCQLGIPEFELLEHQQRHADWCTRLCKLQKERGLYFLYENVATSARWVEQPLS